MDAMTGAALRPVPVLRGLRERQLALVVLCAGTLMIILDGSVVNVALPSIQTDLGFAQTDLAWVINAYLIPFGGLLLLAGRLGDLLGRKRLFISGLAVFTVASLACGLANSQAVLIAARAAQGIGGAAASAVVLGMIVTMFPRPREQARAVGVYSFVAAAGASLGLLAGAALTEAINWHWIFFVNLPLGAATIVAALRLLDENTADTDAQTSDVLGGLLITLGLSLWVYTIVQAGETGWGSTRTIVLCAVSTALVLGFVAHQARARDPLVPLGIFRARNVGWANLVQTLMVAGFAGVFFLGALYMQNVLRFSVAEVGLAFLPAAAAIATLSLKVTPKLVDKVDAKAVLVPGMLLMVAGLALFARVPVDGDYLVDVLPVMLLLGTGAGLCFPAVITVAMADATTSDAGVRSGLVNTTQQMGPALGLAVLAAMSSARTGDALADGVPALEALTSGYRLAFLVGAGIVLVAAVLGMTVVQPAVPKTAPKSLDDTAVDAHDHNLAGVRDPDYLALGLGGTGMMGMLWSVAEGKRAVGVELRGDPSYGVMHWNLNADIYHHLGVIDQLMLERYGADGVPKRGDGSLFRLAECLYSTETEAGDASADEVVSGFDLESHVGGVVLHEEHVDDRWLDGRPHRVVADLGGMTPPTGPDPSRLGRDLAEVLADRPTFLAGAEEVLVILRRYLEAVEAMDLASGREPRVRLFTSHRVLTEPRRAAKGATGFERQPDGRLRVRLEMVRSLDHKGKFRRVAVDNAEIVDLGVPGLIVIAEGQSGADARRLGFTQRDVRVDHGDGNGPVPAQADYLAGLIEVFIDSRVRRRVSTEFDRNGTAYTTRQIAIGHEDDAEVGWVLIEVPEFKTFDPVLAGLVPEGTAKDTAKYFAAHQLLMRDFFLEQTAHLLEIPKAELAKIQLTYGPKLFRLVERIGSDAVVAANAVVAGDSFGNGHVLTSGGVTTGMVGHAHRVLRYWRARESGVTHEQALRDLADGIKADTQAWIRHSESEFSPMPPADRRALAATREHRASLLIRDHSDEWIRVVIQAGRLHAYALPPLADTHPAARAAAESPSS
ncbi:EmrB/QacA subfamily drug resistance transporter [Actinokineospora auranticolor]|uniref:EmrB/QacA subfamily drug resistance transporter n=1 Tax=Actinokineospora auranticolor TaxID=155976 RepID=A0A2S6GIJ6_9PSEU|nr:EmrB/QacA subfamily drug resistance transporter [Actinokineospora auranticolor]